MRASPADYKSALPSCRVQLGAPILPTTSRSSILFEEVVDAFFVVAVEVAGEGGLISYELALTER